MTFLTLAVAVVAAVRVGGTQGIGWHAQRLSDRRGITEIGKTTPFEDSGVLPLSRYWLTRAENPIFLRCQNRGISMNGAENLDKSG